MGFLRDIFAAVADVSGHMSKEQMREALKRAGLAPTEAQLERAWGVVDADRCGRVTLRDFVRGCGQVLVAHAFSPEACAQPSRADVELADLLTSRGKAWRNTCRDAGGGFSGWQALAWVENRDLRDPVDSTLAISRFSKDGATAGFTGTSKCRVCSVK